MGTVFAVKHFEIHDGPGLRTTVFLKGCPLRCLWCHNPEGLTAPKRLAFDRNKCVSCGHCASLCSAHRIEDGKHIFARELCRGEGRCAVECPAGALTLYGREVAPEELLPELLADKIYYQLSGGGVTLSGGEPLLQPEFSLAMSKLLKENGVSVALDTCGFAPWERLEALLPYLDAVLYDIKAADEALHQRLTGQSNRVILENLSRLDKTGIPLYIRIPLIPGQNEGEIPAIGEILTGLKNLQQVKLLPYHALSGSLYRALDIPYPLEGNPLPTVEMAREARELLKSLGLPAVLPGE